MIILPAVMIMFDDVKKKLLILIVPLFLFCGTSVFTAEETEHSTTLQIYGVYYFPDQKGYGTDGGFLPVSYQVVPADDLTHVTDDPGRSIGSTWGSVQGNAVLTHTITVPFLVGTGPLTRGNKLSVDLFGELSPVSLNMGSKIALTPAAFFSTALGVKAGTGWGFFGLFNGLGRDLPGKEYSGPLTEPFSGVVFDLWFSTTLQFDLAAVWPGDWHHIVTQLTPSIHYRGFTGADSKTAWEFEADGGGNLNGFTFKGAYFLGYQMPIALDTVGFLLETSRYIGPVARLSPMDEGGWGSDFTELTFGPIANISFTDLFALTFLLQFQTGRDYTDESIGNRYFEYREFDSIYVDFYRTGFILNFYF